jgi:predicted nucleic-acid-binding Zn-ribbon protein
MIIIFGTKSKSIEENKGTFVCPQCKNLKQYLTKSVQTWFTLFFIPVFPMGSKKHTHVECQGCKGTYYERVLEGNEYNLDGTSVEA